MNDYRGRTAKHFVKYALARFKSDVEDEAYRVYTTDALRTISESTAHFGGSGYITARYYDLVHPQPEDNRSGEEIASDILERAGVTVTGGDADELT